MAYKDKRGYKRENHSDLVHRHRAYHHIYLADRKKYPLPFEAYEVHHIDGDKENNRIDNLAVLTPQEHDDAHDILDLYGLPEEKLVKVLDFLIDLGLEGEDIEDEFKERLKQRIMDGLSYDISDKIEIWNNMIEFHKEAHASKEQEDMKRKERKEKVDKVKGAIGKLFKKK